MVKIMENPIEMDDFGGKPTIFGNTQSKLNLLAKICKPQGGFIISGQSQAS